MPTKTKTKAQPKSKVPVPPAQRLLFEEGEVFSPAEISEVLKVTPRMVRRWIDERKLPEGGVVGLPRGRLIYGWAVNEFVAERRI